MQQVPQTHHLLKRNGVWYFRRRVPLHLVTLFGAKVVQCSLGTSDLTEAKKRRTIKDLKCDAQFESLEHGAAVGSETGEVLDKPVVSPVQLVRDYVDRMDRRSAARLAEDVDDGPREPWDNAAVGRTVYSG